MAAPPGRAASAGDERALALLAPSAAVDDEAAAYSAAASLALAARLQGLSCAFDAPAVDSDEAIARALAEEEEDAGRTQAPPPEDVSRDVAVALACQLDEMARSAPRGALPAGLPPEEPADTSLDAAVAAALAGQLALPWALGAPQPPAPADGRGADLARLRRRLVSYGLEEGVVRGDGNCQFRALADQLYRSERYHEAVRSAVCAALGARPERYSPFVVGAWDAYLAAAALDGTWGDHVTLQAAADAYGVRVCVLTTYERSGYLEVAPLERRSERSLWLSLHAETHYNAVYPAGEVPRQGAERIAQLEGAGSGDAASDRLRSRSSSS